MTPFILKGATKIPPELALPREFVYCPHEQLWKNIRTGVPVVSSSMHGDASPYGETLITETREGIDQAEISATVPSPFGETCLTRTREGADESEITSSPRLNLNAAYSHF